MAAGGSSIDVEDHERSRADSYPESQLARSSSSASASDPSRDRLGSKTSVASSSAGNRSSIISNEAAPGPQEVSVIKQLFAQQSHCMHAVPQPV